MAIPTKGRTRKGGGPPDPSDLDAFRKWLEHQPREWSVVIAARSALRVLPCVREERNLGDIALPIFRAAAIARFAAKYPSRKIESAATSAANAARVAANIADDAATGAVNAAAYVIVAADAVGYAKAAADAATNAASAAYSTAVPYQSEDTPTTNYDDSDTAISARIAIYRAVKHDAQQLYDGALTAHALAARVLWEPGWSPYSIGEAWQSLSLKLHILGNNWRVWTDWYDGFALHEPHIGRTEHEDATFTDVPGKLPWDDGAAAVNTEIARRLDGLKHDAVASEIPEQSPAPVRIEERSGKIAKATDRDSPLGASERDFSAWRDPVIDHVTELTSIDFTAGTNHSRVRDRLTSLCKLLPGEIAEVKERQFRIGYEIERFERLLAAYRSGGDDMPMLNAAQIEDLNHLHVALRMGVDKLERWTEFRRLANESATREGDADGQVVGDKLDDMAAQMEQQPKYFDPELPASFRFLAEAARDPMGATKTVIYGAAKSGENLVSFLGQRALGIGHNAADAVGRHISKAIATSLLVGLSGAALELSGVLPQGWTWLKPLLTALGIAP